MYTPVKERTGTLTLSRALPRTLMHGIIIGAASKPFSPVLVVSHILLFAIGAFCGWLFGA